LQSTNYRIFQDTGETNWKFSLVKDEEDFLIGASDSWDNAASALINAFNHAHFENNYKVLKNEDDGTFSFLLEDEKGTTLAKQVGEPFATKVELQQALEKFIASIKSKKTKPKITEKGADYHIILKDIQG